MKPAITLIPFLFIYMASFGQTTAYYWIGGTSNWGNGSNWSTTQGGSAAGVVPSGNVDIYIGNGSSNATVTVDANYTIADLILQGSGQIFLNGSSYTVTVDGNITINNTGTTGGGTSTISIGSNTTSTQNIIGASSDADYGKLPNLTFSGSGSVALSGYITMGGSTTLNVSTYGGSISPGTGSVGTSGFSDVVFYYNNTINGNVPLDYAEFQGNGGSFTIDNAITLNYDLKLSGSGNCVLNTGTVNLGGNLNDANTSTSSGGNATIVMDGGTQYYTFSSNSGPICNLTVGSSTVNATVSPSSSSNLSLTVGAFNLSSGSIFNAPGTSTNSGTMTIGQSVTGVGYGSSYHLFTNSGGTFNDSYTTVTFTGSGSNSTFIIDVGTSSPVTFNNVNCNIKTTNYGCFITPAGSETIHISGNLTHTSGVISGNWELQGNLTVVGNNAISGGSYSISPSGTITMDGNGPSTYTYSGTWNSYYGYNATAALIISKTGTTPTVGPATGTSNLTIMSLTITSGTFTAPSGNLTIGPGWYGAYNGGSSPLYTIFSITGGAFSANGGTVTFSPAGSLSKFTVDGGGSNSYAATFNNVNCDVNETNYTSILTSASDGPIQVGGSLTHTLGIIAGSWNVQGNLVIASTANSGGTDYPISGTITMSGNSNATYSYSGSYNGYLGTGITASIVIAKSSNSITVSPAPGTSPTINLATQSLSITSGTFVAPPNQLILGAGMYYTASGNVLLFSNNSGGIFNSNVNSTYSSTVILNPEGSGNNFEVFSGTGSNATVFNCLAVNLMVFNYNNALVGGTGETLNVAGTLTITKGILNTTPINVGGDVIISTTINEGSSSLTFNGTNSNQNFTLPSGSPSIFISNITINKPNGGTVTLQSPLTIGTSGQTLALTDGDLITTSTNRLTFTSGTFSGGNNSSYVSGPVARTGTSGFTFPVGGNGEYLPLTISSQSASDTYTASYSYDATNTYNNQYSAGSDLTYIDPCEHWHLSHTGSSSTIITLSWYQPCFNLVDLPGLTIAYVNSSQTTWTNIGSCDATNYSTPPGGTIITNTTYSSWGDGDLTLAKTNALVTANAGNAAAYCSGSSASVAIGGSPAGSGGTGTLTYSWSPATALSTSTIGQPSASPTSTTTYTITVKDAVGETASASVTITVHSLPVAAAGSNWAIHAGGTSPTIGSNPDATGGASPYSYSWSPTFSLSSSSAAQPVASPTASTTYTLILTDANGCTISTSIFVNILPTSSDYYFSNSTGSSGNWSAAAMWQISGYSSGTATTSPPGNQDNVHLGNGTLGATITLDVSPTVGELYIEGGGLIAITPVGTQTISVKGNFSNSNVNAGCIGPAEILFTGTANQFITGTAAIDISNVGINKTSGTVTLSTPVNICTNLNFTEGSFISSPTNLLTFLNGATATGENINSYVYGPVAKIGNSPFTFPIGDGSVFEPIAISAPSSTTESFTAQYFYSENSSPALDATLTYISSCDYWNLSHNSGSSSVNVTLNWSSTSCNILTLNNLKIGSLQSGTWTGLNGTSTSGSSIVSGGITTNSPANSFGNFAIGKYSSASSCTCSQ